MVELSSRKLLTIDGHPIQSNYLARYFSEFFADRARTRVVLVHGQRGPSGRAARGAGTGCGLQEPDAGKPRTAGPHRQARSDGRRDRTGNAPAGRAAGPGQGGVRHARQRHDARQCADRTTRTTDRRGGREQPAHRRALLRPDAADEQARPGRGDGRRRPGPDALHSAVRRAAVYRLVQDLHASAHERIRAAARRVRWAPTTAPSASRSSGTPASCAPRAACATYCAAIPACPTIRCCSRASRKSWATTKARWRCWTAPTARWRPAARPSRS